MPLRRLNLHSRSAPTRYATAMAIFLAALALRLAVLPVEQRAGFLTFYPAMALVFYLCGTGPGLWVLLLSSLSGFYIFYPPFWSWRVTPTSALTTLAFVVSSLIIALVMRTLQSANRRLARALAQVELSDARWKAIVEDQTDVIARFDAHGALLFANGRSQHMFGDAARGVERGNWKDAVHPEDLPRVLDQLAKLTPQNPQVRFDCRVVDIDGKVHWQDFVDHAFYDASGRLLEIQSIGRDVTHRKALEGQLREAEVALRDLYENAPVGYFSLDEKGHFLRLNKAVEDILACKAADMLGSKGPQDFATPDSRTVFATRLRQLIDEDLSTPYELDLLGTNGLLRHVRIHASAVRDARGNFLYTRSAMLDLTELLTAKRALEHVVREQHAMLHNDLVGIIKVRRRETIWTNPAFDRMFGYAPGELLGKSSRVLYPDGEAYLALGREAYRILQGRGTFRTQARMLRKSGEAIWVDISGSLLSETQQESLWMMLDISALKAHERHIEDIAFHDSLTGLANRVLLLQLLERELATRRRLDNELAVCFVDLDGFKPVNDLHGHDAGDELLRATGERLQESVRGHDIVARLGGDEFVVVLTHLSDSVVVRDTLHRLLDRLCAPVALQNGALVRVSASLGVAICPGDGDSAQVLLRRADEAMYHAKRAGRNQMRFFNTIPEVDGLPRAAPSGDPA